MVKILKYIDNIREQVQKRYSYERLGDLYSDSKINRRRYHRHSMKTLSGCIVKINDLAFELLDLSYGGAAIYVPENYWSQLPQGGKEFSATLSILGISCRTRMMMVFKQGSRIGIAFDLKDSALAGFLDATIYYLDAGLLLKRVSRNSVSSIFQGPSWNSYGSFNGNVEVHISFGIDEQLEEVNISYLKALRKEFVVFSHKATTVATIPEGQLDLVTKKKILRRTLLIITGFRQIGGTTHFDGLIQSAIGLLKK